jgi:hypothetical protein
VEETLEENQTMKPYAIVIIALVMLQGCMSVRTTPLGQGFEVGVDLTESPAVVQRYIRGWAEEPGKMTWNHILTVAAGYGAKEFFKNYDVSVKRRQDDKPQSEQAEALAPSTMTVALPDGTVLTIPVH